MWTWAKTFWKEHGTKILGVGGTLLGTLSLLDATTINLIKTLFGPKWGPLVSSVLMIIGGIMTARRGWTNSNNQGNKP